MFNFGQAAFGPDLSQDCPAFLANLCFATPEPAALDVRLVVFLSSDTGSDDMLLRTWTTVVTGRPWQRKTDREQASRLQFRFFTIQFLSFGGITDYNPCAVQNPSFGLQISTTSDVHRETSIPLRI